MSSTSGREFQCGSSVDGTSGGEWTFGPCGDGPGEESVRVMGRRLVN